MEERLSLDQWGREDRAGLQEQDDVTGSSQSHLKTAVQSHASEAGGR